MEETKNIESSGAITDARKGVQSVDRAFEVLRVFEHSERPLSVKDIADKTGMASPQVHHYLVSLTRSGVIQQRPKGTYELGVFALQLGLCALRRLEPIELAIEAGREFRDANGESTFISLWGSHGATIIRYFDGFMPVAVEIRTGFTMPLMESATGHVFLTWLDDKATADMVIPSNVFNPKEIKIATKKAGLGHVHGDLLPRISALSAPVFDRDGQLAFAITTLGWIGNFDDSLDGALANKLRDTSKKLSKALGYQV